MIEAYKTNNVEKAKQAKIMLFNGESFKIIYAEENTIYCINEETGQDYQFTNNELDSARFFKLVGI